MNYVVPISSESALLSRINNGETEAYGELYSLFFNELYYYTSKLYQNTEIQAADAVQDVFLAMWQSPGHNFLSLSGIKAYLFVSVRNNFKKYIRHTKHKNKFLDYSADEFDRFEADVFEAEIFNLFHTILDMLPAETAEIFQLFFKGWSAKEIAEKMGKSTQTIYNIRSQALAILRKRLSKDVMGLLLTLLSGS